MDIQKTTNMSPRPYTNFSKLLYLYGFAMWMTIITFNNIVDPLTNTAFIDQMISMSKFDPTSEIGSGLLWKAVDSKYSTLISTVFLWIIIIIELIIDILMWRAFIKVLKATIKRQVLDQECLNSVNLALSAFLSVFVLFITGGIWFGYWMHLGAFQIAHLTGIIISLLGLIYFNQDHRLMTKEH